MPEWLIILIYFFVVAPIFGVITGKMLKRLAKRHPKYFDFYDEYKER